MVARVQEWGADRLGTLSALCALILDGESLTVDDLELISGDGVVLAADDGTAAVVVTTGGNDVGACIQLLVVHPGRRRQGLGTRLVGEAEAWALDKGATSLGVDGSSPFSLFPGVDTRWTGALCLFERLGYEPTGLTMDLTCPTLLPSRRAPHGGTHVARVESDEDLATLMAFVCASVPDMGDEFDRAGESGTALIALDPQRGDVVGALAHSVNRIGVVGAIHVAADARTHGVGSALVGAALSELSIAGLRNAEIVCHAPLEFYVRACDARVGRISQKYRRELGQRSEG